MMPSTTENVTNDPVSACGLTGGNPIENKDSSLGLEYKGPVKVKIGSRPIHVAAPVARTSENRHTGERPVVVWCNDKGAQQDYDARLQTLKVLKDNLRRVGSDALYFDKVSSFKKWLEHNPQKPFILCTSIGKACLCFDMLESNPGICENGVGHRVATLTVVFSSFVEATEILQDPHMDQREKALRTRLSEVSHEKIGPVAIVKADGVSDCRDVVKPKLKEIVGPGYSSRVCDVITMINKRHGISELAPCEEERQSDSEPNTPKIPLPPGLQPASNVPKPLRSVTFASDAEIQEVSCYIDPHEDDGYSTTDSGRDHFASGDWDNDEYAWNSWSVTKEEQYIERPRITSWSKKPARPRSPPSRGWNSEESRDSRGSFSSTGVDSHSSRSAYNSYNSYNGGPQTNVTPGELARAVSNHIASETSEDLHRWSNRSWEWESCDGWSASRPRGQGRSFDSHEAWGPQGFEVGPPPPPQGWPSDPSAYGRAQHCSYEAPMFLSEGRPVAINHHGYPLHSRAAAAPPPGLLRQDVHHHQAFNNQRPPKVQSLTQCPGGSAARTQQKRPPKEVPTSAAQKMFTVL